MTNQIIIAEKPRQAEAIKLATGIKTIPAAGHLLGLKPKERLWEPPYFDLEWVTPKKKTREKLDKMVKKIREADEVIIGTDFDAEGQLIAYNILKEAGIEPTDVKRMKFSSLEMDELKGAYENPIDFDLLMAKSAETRHYLDWFFGMNISKALTIRMKRGMDTQKRYFLTPVGRVQTPVLNYLALRENEIQEFLGVDEWKVNVYGVIPGENTVFDITMLFLENEDKVAEVTTWRRGKVESIIEHERERSFLPPNKDFVVKECLKKGISPEIVDRVMQGLYLDGYISYPRTTSQNYTGHGIDTTKYLDALDMDDLDIEVKGNFMEPNEREPEGPHPAIYPIKHYHGRDIDRLVWDVIVEVFVKCHLPSEEYIEKEIKIDIGSKFIRSFETEPNNLIENQRLALLYDVNLQKTTPKLRYNLGDVYKFMVEQNLGTVDTRTQIQTKLMRDYIFETNDGLFTSSKAVKITKVLKEICPDIISVDLTKKFEGYVQSIRKDDSEIDGIMDEAKETVTNIVNKLLENGDD